MAAAEVAEMDAMLVAIAPEAEENDAAVAEDGAVAAAEEALPEAPQTQPRKRTRAQRESVLASSLIQVVTDSLGTPAKAEMEKALTKASASDPHLRRELKSRGLEFRRSVGKLGRPEGPALSDRELFAKLVPFSEETSTIHKDTLVPRRTLAEGHRCMEDRRAKTGCDGILGFGDVGTSGCQATQ